MPGRDQDDAVGRVGTVQRRRRRPFHDVDRLEVLGIQVVDTAGGGAADVADAGRAVLAGDADAVQDVHRLVGQREAVRPTNAHARWSARHRSRQDVDAGGLRDQEVGDVGDRRRFDQLGGIDPGDRIADFLLGLIARGRDHHLVYGVRRQRQREVDDRRLARIDADHARPRPEADGGGPHGELSAGDARQRVAALGIGLCDERRPHNGDARAHERLPVGLIGDAARDCALLGPRDGADAADEPTEHEERAQRGANGNAHTDPSFKGTVPHTLTTRLSECAPVPDGRPDTRRARWGAPYRLRAPGKGYCVGGFGTLQGAGSCVLHTLLTNVDPS